MDDQDILGIIEKHKGTHGELLSILEEIQSIYGYLPEEKLRLLADNTGYSLTDIYGVATFYKSFSLRERGKHYITVCSGTACHVRGSSRIVDEFERQLSIRSGETTEDKEFTLETVNCLGACALGPTVVADSRYFRHVTTADVKQILDHTDGEHESLDPGKNCRIFPVQVGCFKCGHSLMDPEHPIDNYPSISLMAACGQEKGWLRLSCIYGSHHFESQRSFPDGAVTSLLCPHCGETLKSAVNCQLCGTKMSMIAVGKSATVYVCNRRGCKGHRLDMIPVDEV